MIHENDLIEWPDITNTGAASRIDRILRIYPASTFEQTEICVIDRNPKHENAKPSIKLLIEYTTSIEEGDAHIICDDPYPLKQYPAEFQPIKGELVEEQTKRQAMYQNRDQRWKVIQSVVADIYQYSISSKRGILVRAAMTNSGHDRKTIETWCRWFLQAGCQRNALMPHYEGNCGAPGKRRSSQSKLGRPRSVRSNEFGKIL
jgi:hypothetical protein